MEVFLDCLPCILRQVLEASRMSTDDKGLQDTIMAEAMDILKEYHKYTNSPELGRDMHRIVKERTGAIDPYREIKQRDIKTALSLYPMLKQFLCTKRDRVRWALKVAATGNVLDSALGMGSNIEQSIERELNKPFSVCDTRHFEKQLKKAGRLLIIGDNAGETVFDRVMIEELGFSPNVTYAVRAAPVINDAVMQDALDSGLGGCARVISTGCDVPGVLLGECSTEFLDVFYSADIVICKGQGNYETLSDCDRDIYFLLKVKCPALCSSLGAGLNEYVFKYHDAQNKEEGAAGDI